MVGNNIKVTLAAKILSPWSANTSYPASALISAGVGTCEADAMMFVGDLGPRDAPSYCGVTQQRRRRRRRDRISPRKQQRRTGRWTQSYGIHAHFWYLIHATTPATAPWGLPQYYCSSSTVLYMWSVRQSMGFVPFPADLEMITRGTGQDVKLHLNGEITVDLVVNLLV